MQRVTLSLVSHTNVGKTTLARTLLRRDVGEVLDQAHVTEVSTPYPLIATADAELVLWDTPGFGDSARLLARLRRHDQPLLWFFQALWDRVTDRPLWSSQQAALNIRDEADVVLYLVNAAEEPADAGYVAPELELLSWIGRPILLLLNQAGEASYQPELRRQQLEVWQRHVARFPLVQDVLMLDAFSRSWVQENQLLERVVELLPAERQPTMRALQVAWDARNLEVFARSIDALTAYLAAAVHMREELPERRPGRMAKTQAMHALAERLETATGELMALLLSLHGLEGTVAGRIEKYLEAFNVEGEDLLDPERGALVGGVVSGALGGLAADILAGGLTFGGGLVAGAILGALGGAGLARGYQLVKGDQLPAVSWSAPFLDRLLRQALLRYLAVAHFGRGRGAYLDEEPQRWQAAVDTALRASEWHSVWKELAREPLAPGPRERLRQRLDDAVREVLAGAYPEAADHLLGTGKSFLSND